MAAPTIVSVVATRMAGIIDTPLWFIKGNWPVVWRILIWGPAVCLVFSLLATTTVPWLFPISRFFVLVCASQMLALAVYILIFELSDHCMCEGPCRCHEGYEDFLGVACAVVGLLVMWFSIATTHWLVQATSFVCGVLSSIG